MINNELIKEVEEIFYSDHSGHDFAHTERVMRLAVKLAECEGADAELVALAALLHDVDDYKLTGKSLGGTERARALLEKYGYCGETIELVAEIIRTVSFKGKDTETPGTLEGKIVQDADRLDAIGAIGIARAFQYGGAHSRKMYDPADPPKKEMSAEEYVNSRSTTINHFYEKLLLIRDLINTESAKLIAVERHKYLEGFLSRFLAEWNGEL